MLSLCTNYDLYDVVRQNAKLSLFPPGANVIKLLLSAIYGFSYKARVFVRLGLKSLPGTKTLAYYENL